jgi:DNA-binding transcriptional MocR family regulator
MAVHGQAMRSGISLAPGPMFSAAGQFGNCLRINFGHPLDARTRTALAQVGRLAKQLCPK